MIDKTMSYNITQEIEFFSKSDFCKYQESKWYESSIYS